jgi:nucleoside-diphosphate-sugar epimerase
LHRRRVGFFTHNRHFDIGKAVRMLGYAPGVDTRAGIERTVRWYASHGHMAPLPDAEQGGRTKR